MRLPTTPGVVVDVQVLVRRGVEKDERTIAIERVEIDRLAKDRDDEKNILENNHKQNLISIFKNKISISNIVFTKGNNRRRCFEIKIIEILEKFKLMITIMDTFASQKKIFSDAVFYIKNSK